MTGKTLKELNVQVGDVVFIMGDKFEIGENPYKIPGQIKTKHGFLYETHIPLTIIRATNYTDWKFCTAPDGAYTHAMPGGAVAWRVKIEPELGSMTVYFSDRFKFTYDTIDGIPDCSSVKMELLE